MATSPAELISRFADREAEILADSRFRDGCPIATVALEMSSESDAIRTTCRDIFDGWIAVLANCLEPYLGDLARVTAERAFMLLEGRLLLSRVERDALMAELPRSARRAELRPRRIEKTPARAPQKSGTDADAARLLKRGPKRG
jgi:TetR/AcrR family transcriptional repressor of lmrAB and yxaGH operons